MGPNRGLWIWWVGQHGELRTPDWHIWALHQVLPMPTTASTNGATSAAQRHRTFPSSPPPSWPLTQHYCTRVRVETNRPRYTRLLLNWLMVQCMLLLLWRMSKSDQSSVTSIPAFIMCIGRVINLIIMYFFFNFFLFIAFKVVEHLICHAQFHKKKKWKIKQKKN